MNQAFHQFPDFLFSHLSQFTLRSFTNSSPSWTIILSVVIYPRVFLIQGLLSNS
ncbi:hypothetical protein K469DRAFT_704545 [Zopfia rhizophila CBS 207.26]|uniref:Uncharacterized protein n=1 Tax=Zopfia rhizophila CBS 207.26 TaxID=1314779 RepID=A0A6A6EA32_9PEZI|nr:hypothetical protein K469DRAFT_704545 [Zopfia rhizophila CBS 207.26]